MAASHETASAARGRAAEDFALRWLQQRGLLLIERNYRCRFGEIDLVLSDGPALVFVEVRMRRGGGFGGAAASVTPAKLRRFTAAAECFLRSRAASGRAARIDVLALEGGTPSNPARVEWLRGVTA